MNEICHKLKNIIQDLNLDLSGRVVLTEAATGPYSVTPILAAIANAKVYAFGKSSQYGSMKEIYNEINGLKSFFKDLDISIIEELTSDIISKADIITNSGHLRPLNRAILKYLKPGSVIPLMYESWELRDDDIDIEYCINNNIIISGTNERHRLIDVFSYLGEMAIKLIFESGKCLHNNKFILVANNDFGPYIANSIKKLCHSVGVIDLNRNKSKYTFDKNCVWISDFPKIEIPNDFKSSEAIIFTAFPFSKEWVGNNSVIKPEYLSTQIDNPCLLRFAGHINEVDLTYHNIKYFPEKVKPGYMGILPSSIGFDPVIKLQAGGLKVGEELLSKNFESEFLQILNFHKI